MRMSLLTVFGAVLIVFPSIKVQEHVGNDKSCVWKAPDFADGELKDETFCIRFGSVESGYFSYLAHICTAVRSHFAVCALWGTWSAVIFCIHLVWMEV